MKTLKLLVSLSPELKSKLDAERKRGTSAAGLIRYLLEQHFRKGTKSLSL